MTKILVTTHSNPTLYIEIDFSNTKWSSLLPDKLLPFKIEELKRPCSAYPTGVFPGAEDSLNDRQIFRVCNFTNYMEFSKIVSDELVPISGQQFLTTKFYDRRKKGWESEKPLKKNGEVQGYCINGDVYAASEKETVDKIFYGIVYKSFVQKIPEFILLQKYLQDGLCLILIGEDNDFLGHLAEVLILSLNTRQ